MRWRRVIPPKVSKKRILLVSVKTHVHELVHTPPLGLLYLASYLREVQPDVHIEILDQKIGRLSDAQIAAKVEEGGYGILGLSCFTPAANRAADIARLVRSRSPDTTIVIGGPHPSAYMQDSLAPEFDYAVFGEGEIAFSRLFDVLDKGGSVDRLPGVIYRENGGVVAGPPAPPLENLDDLPMPAWDLYDLRPYWRYEGFCLMGHRRYAPIFTSRGCPYSCSFCHSIFGRRFRARSPENVLNEMHDLKRRFGAEEFDFIDDNFNMKNDRAIDILKRIRAELPDVRLLFPNGVRSDLMDESFIRAMEAANTYYVSFAVESASPRIQKMIRKNLDLDAVWANIERCAEIKRMFLNGYFMLGFPGETLEEMEQSVSFAVRSKLHTASFFLVMPFRGTPMYKSLDEETRALVDKNQDRMYYDSLIYNLSTVSDQDLAETHRRALSRFYMRPKLVWRVFRTHPRPIRSILSGSIEVVTKAVIHVHNFLFRRRQIAAGDSLAS